MVSVMDFYPKGPESILSEFSVNVFLSPTQVACLGIELITLWGLRFNSRSWHLSFVTRLSYSTFPGPGIELMTLWTQWT